MKKTVYILTLLALAVITPAKAQYDETNNLFYHTLRTPQSTLYNPAFFPTNNTFFIMLPGVDLQFGGPLQLDHVVYYDKATNHTVISIDSILDALTDKTKFRFNATIDLFGFGFKVKNTFITFNTRLINSVNIGFPKETINALRGGNISADGTPISSLNLVNGDIFNLTSYLETGVGVGHYFAPINLTVGLRAKLLYGIANIQTDNTRIDLNTTGTTNPESMTASMYYDILAATCVPYDTTAKKFQVNVGDLLSIGKANTGIAFDLGAKYDWGPFSFSFAINDLSAGIHWKSNVVRLVPKNGEGDILFNGLDITNVLDHGALNTDSIANYIKDNIENMKPEYLEEGDYWYCIPTKINLGASYSFAKFFRAGLLFHGQLDRGLISKSTDDAARTVSISGDVTNTFRWNLTGTLGANVFNWMELIVGNSVVNDGEKMNFVNPGFGIILTPATVFQTYIMVDYLSNFYLVQSKSFNVKIGFNLLFGKGGRTKVSSYSPVE